MSAKQSGAQEAMQKFGRFLSGMVMPNIGAFIGWGLLTALFIPTGWLPNEYLAQAGGPMAKWLIPLLIGFTGGSTVYGHRGGVVGAIATAGVIAGSDIPMFLGAMIMGPFGGWCIKKFDNAVSDSIPGGFEMLVNNFSAGRPSGPGGLCRCGPRGAGRQQHPAGRCGEHRRHGHAAPGLPLYRACEDFVPQ